MASVRTDANGKPLTKPSLKRALWRAIGHKLYRYWLANMFEELVRMTSPIFLALLLQSITDCVKGVAVCSNHTHYNATDNTNTTLSEDCTETVNPSLFWEPWLYGLGLVSVIIIVWQLHHVCYFGFWRIGMQLRVACTVLIFNKSLSLDIQALQKVSVGHVVNLASSDVEKLQVVSTHTHTHTHTQENILHPVERVLRQRSTLYRA